MFAGVYVAKEAVEHILLSGGHSHSTSLPSMAPASAALNGSTGGVIRGFGLHGAGEMGTDGHHHHWGDELPETLGCVVSFVVFGARLMNVFSLSLSALPLGFVRPCLTHMLLHGPPDSGTRLAS